MEPLAYTIDQVAEVTQLSRREIERRISAGEITIVKVGRRTLIRRDRVDEWLLSHEAGAA